MAHIESSPYVKFKEAVQQSDPDVVRARRTAFISRFIVLRESKRSRAHRQIERLCWGELTTPEELAVRFREVFLHNGDNMGPVDRDLKRALRHTQRSMQFFVKEYSSRSTNSFIEALYDYGRSNALLFGEGEMPKSGGWRLPQELQKDQAE